MGIDLALKEIGGKIDGVPLVVIQADTGGTPPGTMAAMNKLAGQTGLSVMIGPGTSPESLDSLPATDSYKIPLIDASSTSPVIRSTLKAENHPWFFHLNPDEKMLAQAFSAEIARTRSSIAIVSVDDAFSRQVAAEYVAAFREAGMTISREEYVPPTTIEYRPLLFQIRQSRPDALFLVMQEDSCAILMRQYKKSFTTIPVYSRGACTTNLFRQIAKDDPSSGSGITEAVIFSELQDPALAKSFEQIYKQPITGHRMAGFYTMKYAIIPAVQAILQSGNSVNPESMQAALSKLQVETPLGKLVFDSNHQATLNAGLVTANDNGEIQLAGVLPLK
jgi:branched-chain amino acid transport system substrate-binding protein